MAVLDDAGYILPEQWYLMFGKLREDMGIKGTSISHLTIDANGNMTCRVETKVVSTWNRTKYQSLSIYQAKHPLCRWHLRP